jgi:hypothetical protein
MEWQYAAQSGDADNTYPWGASDDTSKRPRAVLGGHTPAPTDSQTLSAGANALGLIDLVRDERSEGAAAAVIMLPQLTSRVRWGLQIGNVWQYTSSEYADRHTRFVLLRGGSFYQPQAASDFQNWYFASADARQRPGGGVRLDRHAKYFLMGPSYDRAATIGFRCAYDVLHGPLPGASSTPPLPRSNAWAVVGAVLLAAGVSIPWLVACRVNPNRVPRHPVVSATEMCDVSDAHEDAFGEKAPSDSELNPAAKAAAAAMREGLDAVEGERA